MPPDRVRGIVYDLDGVLINSMDAWYRVIERGVRVLGHPAVSFEHFRRTFGQGVEADRIEFFPEWTAQEVSRFYDRTFLEELQAIRVHDGALGVLEEARRRGLRQAVATNTPLNLARRVLSAMGLDIHLDALAAAGEAPEKPAPDLLLLALSRLTLQAPEALYVGDSATDLRAARAAGIRMAGLGIPADITLGCVSDLLAHV
jgi:HAD superfamily hydrolase (TIGR01549 family)